MIKILAVDDEPGICDVIKKTFSCIGFSVFTATTARKAMAVLEKERPGIIFLDILMEDGSGIELLRMIKQRDPEAVVIMVTAKYDSATREQAMSAGADEFITKPFSRNYLRDVVVQKIGDLLDLRGSMKTPSLLLVDDEQEFRAVIRDFISSRYECAIAEAGNGPEAIHLVKELAPDVILMDIKMPGLSGIEVISEIKRISPHSRVIALSAWKSAEVVAQAVNAGAEDYLSKPVSLPVLGEKLRSVLISLGKCRRKRI